MFSLIPERRRMGDLQPCLPSWNFCRTGLLSHWQMFCALLPFDGLITHSPSPLATVLESVACVVNRPAIWANLVRKYDILVLCSSSPTPNADLYTFQGNRYGLPRPKAGYPRPSSRSI